MKYLIPVLVTVAFYLGFNAHNGLFQTGLWLLPETLAVVLFWGGAIIVLKKSEIVGKILVCISATGFVWTISSAGKVDEPFWTRGFELGLAMGGGMALALFLLWLARSDESNESVPPLLLRSKKK